MRTHRLIILSFTLSLLLAIPAAAQLNPAEKYGSLFHDVQMAGVFTDSKTFADCIPLYTPETILNKYEEYRKQDNFDLKRFVLEHFQLPKNPALAFATDTTNSVREHINQLWEVLKRRPSNQLRGSLIVLPEPYIVPGGRFREIYYWDSFFTMLGLEVSGEDQLIRNMLNNFSFLINTLGFIPNGNRTYYTSRSQPPFFSQMVRLLADAKGDSVLINYLPEMEQEYAFWMSGADSLSPEAPAYRRLVRLPDGEIMNRYWDDNPSPRPESYKEDYELAQESERNAEDLYRNIRAACESGWDFSSRWLRDGISLESIHTTEIIPVDLNSLMYGMEMTLADAHGAAGNRQQAEVFRAKARDRAQAILKYCWDEREKFFADYDFVAGASTDRPSLAATYPLYFEIATDQQAKRVARRLRKDFLEDGGLLTTLLPSGQQWDAPNGWAPLQWMAYTGLKNYGSDQLADEIAEKWISNNVRVFENTGKMVEKYNVSDISLEAGGGEYPVQDGFGWSNGVLLKFTELRR
jgi:alpha,alpha-trehalase